MQALEDLAHRQLRKHALQDDKVVDIPYWAEAMYSMRLRDVTWWKESKQRLIIKLP